MVALSYFRTYFGLLLVIGGLVEYVPEEVRSGHGSGWMWMLVVLGMVLLALEWASFRGQLHDDA